jgi:hypothetical protein
MKKVFFKLHCPVYNQVQNMGPKIFEMVYGPSPFRDIQTLASIIKRNQKVVTPDTITSRSLGKH